MNNVNPARTVDSEGRVPPKAGRVRTESGAVRGGMNADESGGYGRDSARAVGCERALSSASVVAEPVDFCEKS